LLLLPPAQSIATAAGPEAVLIAIAKRNPKRRCRIPRRPHPDLDFFFGRYENAGLEPSDETRSEIADLQHTALVTTPLLKFRPQGREAAQ